MNTGELSSVLDAVPDAIIVADAEGVVLTFNAAAERIFGIGRAAAVGHDVADLIVPPKQRAVQRKALHRLAHGGAKHILGRPVELEAQRGDGELVPVGMVLSVTNESPFEITAWIRDLTLATPGTHEHVRRQALLDCAEQVAGLGSLEWLTDRGQLLWSDNLYRILGYEPGEVRPSAEMAMDAVHPDDRERIRGNWQLWLDGGTERASAYRIVRPDGSVRHLRTTLAAWDKKDGPPRLVAAVQDMTEQWRAEREIAAYTAVSEALVEWPSFGEGMAGLLRRLAQALGFDRGVVWVPFGYVLRARVTWQHDGTEPSEFEAAQEALSYPRGSGMPGIAWESGEPAICESPGCRRERDSAPDNDCRAALAIPALHEGEILAVLEFHSVERLELTDRLRRSLTGIGYEIGIFLSRRRGELEPPVLTPRELQILQLAAGGRSGPMIAEQLSISPATVKTHFEHAYEKMGVADRSEAVAEVLRLGLIS